MSSSGRTISFLVLWFVSGALVGATLMNLAEHYWLHAHAANEYDIRQHRAVAQAMRDTLDLSATQKAQVDAVLQQTVGQYQTLEQRLAPQFDQLRQQDREHLRALLTASQREKFDQLVAQVDAEYPLNERPAVLSAVPCTGDGPGH